MTIGLIRWLRSLAPEQSMSQSRRLADLHSMRFSARDLADLNLPEDVARRFRLREAEEARRRVVL